MSDNEVFSMQVWHRGKAISYPSEQLIHHLDKPQSWSFHLPTEHAAMPLRLLLNTRYVLDEWMFFNVALQSAYGAWLTPMLPGMAYIRRWSIPSVIPLASTDPDSPGYFALTMQALADNNVES